MGSEKKARTETKRNRIIDWAVFAVLLGAASAVTFLLFYRQTLGNSQWYPSDMEAYILEMQGLESKYSFPYPVFFKFAALLHLFMGPELSVALATMLLNSLGMVLTKLAFNHIALEKLENALGRERQLQEREREGRGAMAGGRSLSWLAGILISLAAVSLFFISMLYPPKGHYLPGIRFRYVGVFSANPFHNATYMAARPFTILAFLWFAKLLPIYERGPRSRRALSEAGKAKGAQPAQALESAGGQGPAISDYVFFSIFLLAATMTKPSFTLVMVSAAGLLMLCRLFRSRFRNFIPTVLLGLCFVPTFLDLLYQYSGVFVPQEGQERGVGFCLGEVWAAYCDSIPLAVCLAVGFPLLVLVLNYKEWKRDSLFRFSWLLYLAGLAEAFLLYEKGFRKWDFNFSWGYMCGVFFCHFGALALLLQVTAARVGMIRRKAGRREASGPEVREGESGVCRASGPEVREGESGVCRASDSGSATRWAFALLALQWLAYLWHVLCGIAYFASLMSGATYY